MMAGMRFQPAAWAAIVLLHAATTVAAPTARDRATARSLAQEAQRAMKSGAHADAAAALERALALDPSPQLRLDLARARMKTLQLVEAKELLDELADPAIRPKPDRRVVAAAQKLRDELFAKLPSILVTVTGVDPSLAITELNGKVITPGVEIPVNPGEYSVVADAEGMVRAREHLTLAEGQHGEVTLRFVRAAPARSAQPVETSDGSKIPAAIAFGVGGAGLALGAIFGAMAMSDKSAAEAYCKGNRCSPRAQPSIDSSLVNGNVSTAAFIVGGAGVCLGTVLWFTVGSKKTAQARLTPWIGPGEAGLRGEF